MKSELRWLLFLRVVPDEVSSSAFRRPCHETGNHKFTRTPPPTQTEDTRCFFDSARKSGWQCHSGTLGTAP
jgi:hypothetical protein